MNWKIYYSDGTTFSSSDGTPQRAPGLGVLVIVMASKDHGWQTQAGNDFYVWDCRGGEVRWWGVDRFGLDEYLFMHPGQKVALAGRTTSADHFSKIYEQACVDPDFPGKTSFSNKEHHP